MKSKFLNTVITCIIFSLSCLVNISNATIIEFTSGTSYLDGGGTCTTTPCWGVDYYEEDGFIFDFIGTSTGDSVGDYYGAGNEVIHSHWDGLMSAMEIRKSGGGTFDLNYFVLKRKNKKIKFVI